MIKTFDLLIEIAGDKQARKIVAEIANKQVLADFDRHSDYLFVRKLLTERTPRPVIRDKLIDAGNSERSAYRLIERALQKSFNTA